MMRVLWFLFLAMWIVLLALVVLACRSSSAEIPSVSNNVFEGPVGDKVGIVRVTTS
jgi:hypothetical protein